MNVHDPGGMMLRSLTSLLFAFLFAFLFALPFTLLVVTVSALPASAQSRDAMPSDLVGAWDADMEATLATMPEEERALAAMLLGSASMRLEFTADGGMYMEMTMMGEVQTQDGTWDVREIDGSTVTIDTAMIDGGVPESEVMTATFTGPHAIELRSAGDPQPFIFVRAGQSGDPYPVDPATLPTDPAAIRGTWDVVVDEPATGSAAERAAQAPAIATLEFRPDGTVTRHGAAGTHVGVYSVREAHVGRLEVTTSFVVDGAATLGFWHVAFEDAESIVIRGSGEEAPRFERR